MLGAHLAPPELREQRLGGNLPKARDVDPGVGALQDAGPEGDGDGSERDNVGVIEFVGRLRHRSARLALEKAFEVFRERGICPRDHLVSDSDQPPDGVRAFQVLEFRDPLERGVVLRIEPELDVFGEVFGCFIGFVIDLRHAGRRSVLDAAVWAQENLRLKCPPLNVQEWGEI